VLATGTMLAAGVLLLPFAVVQRPEAAPGWQALGALAGIAVLGTASAQLVFYRMVPLYGARRISLVAYLMPGIAIMFGAVFLSEPVTAAMVVGLGLILLGVALGSGYVLAAHRAETAEGSA
jgi:drug/metabolite transporter (DMT)-like permease